MNSTQMPQREKIDAVYIVKALAIIGVVLVHISAIPVGMVAPESKTFAVYNFINIFSKFGTPTFIFLSAFVLFYSYFHRPFSGTLLLGFYKRRFMFVLLPYLIFSLGYYILRFYGTSWEVFMSHASLKELFYALLTGKAFYHLYFVFISIQFYLLFPVLLWLLQRYSYLTRHLIWAGIVLQWTFVLVNQWEWQYADKGSVCLSYISYYSLGAFVGINYESAKNWLLLTRERISSCQIWIWRILWLFWGSAAIVNVYIWYQLRAYDVVLHALVYEALWHLHAYMTVLILFQASCFLINRLSCVWANALLHLGKVSFGVYILHAGLLFFYFSIPVGDSPLVYHSSVAGGFLWTFFSSWIIVGLTFQLTQGAWILFGPQPAEDPFRQKCTKATGGGTRIQAQ